MPEATDFQLDFMLCAAAPAAVATASNRLWLNNSVKHRCACENAPAAADDEEDEDEELAATFVVDEFSVRFSTAGFRDSASVIPIQTAHPSNLRSAQQ